MSLSLSLGILRAGGGISKKRIRGSLRRTVVLAPWAHRAGTPPSVPSIPGGAPSRTTTPKSPPVQSRSRLRPWGDLHGVPPPGMLVEVASSASSARHGDANGRREIAGSGAVDRLALARPLLSGARDLRRHVVARCMVEPAISVCTSTLGRRRRGRCHRASRPRASEVLAGHASGGVARRDAG